MSDIKTNILNALQWFGKNKIKPIETQIGTTSIADIGDGTITGAISSESEAISTNESEIETQKKTWVGNFSNVYTSTHTDLSGSSQSSFSTRVTNQAIMYLSFNGGSGAWAQVRVNGQYVGGMGNASTVGSGASTVTLILPKNATIGFTGANVNSIIITVFEMIE